MKSHAVILLLGAAIASPAGAVQKCDTHFSAANACPHNAPHFSACTLADGYEPSVFTASYASPQCYDATKSKSVSFDAVYNLVNTARPDAANKLCQLQLFVSAYTPNLGIWEVPHAAASGGDPERKARGSGGVYIVVRQDALSSGESLAEEENRLLAALLDIPYSQYDKTKLPFFEDTASTTGHPEAAILAIVAHELGHVLLADKNADDAGGPGHKHARPCAQPTAQGVQPNDSCFDSAFLGTPGGGVRWNKNNFYQNQRRWIAFGDQNTNKHLNPVGDIGNVRDLVRAGNLAGANAAIHSIYNATLVSLFAAVSPEEDFVETYKYRVLADVGLQLTMKFPAPVNDVINDVFQQVRGPSGELGGKIDCVNHLTK